MSDSSALTPREADAPPAADELKSAIEIWKQIISVQMHFNDIEMRIRNLYVTVLLGTAAAAGWVLEKKLKLELSSFYVHYAMALLIAGLMASRLFYFMDRYWYHQLLRGSVEQGKVLDANYGVHIRALGLTSAISGASPIAGFRRSKWGRWMSFFRVISPPTGSENPNDLHSTGKIELFYKTPIRVLEVLIVLSLLFGGITFGERSTFQLLTSTVRTWMCR
jgi:hypothetical protein